MKVVETSLPGVLLVEPRVFEDARGFFLETFRSGTFEKANLPTTFAQDNWSRSSKGTLRGLHFQNPRSQGKLVWVIRGAVWDVAVDVRKGSPTFGKWFGAELSDSNRRQMWLPQGFAHGFCVLSDVADFVYKCTDSYAPDCERSVLWNDPAIGVQWPVVDPKLSPKDAAAKPLAEVEGLPSL